MKVRMMPIESVFAKYPRKIRDLKRNLGRRWNFICQVRRQSLTEQLLMR